MFACITEIGIYSYVKNAALEKKTTCSTFTKFAKNILTRRIYKQLKLNSLLSKKISTNLISKKNRLFVFDKLCGPQVLKLLFLPEMSLRNKKVLRVFFN